MKRAFRAAALAGLLAFAPRTHAAPSETVLSRLEAALALLTKADAPTTYVVSTVFEISDGRKKLLQTVELVERVSLAPGQPVRRETLSRKITGDAGEQEDANSGASRRSGAGGSGSWTIVFPVGKDRPRFSFGHERREGSLSVVDFAPAPSAASDEGLTRGTLTFDPALEMPSRMEAVPVHNPPFTSRLSLSFTFGSVDGFAYPATASFSAEGGFLFFRRGIQSVSTISELRRSQ